MGSEVYSDNMLIEKALSGDRRSFELLYERYEEKIYNFLYRMLGKREKAEEAAQDTFVLVFRSLHRYSPGKSAGPWIYRIAYNAALNYYRADKKHKHDVSFDAEDKDEKKSLAATLGSTAQSPDRQIRTEEFQEALQAALNALPEKYRSVLVLHDIEQRSYEEIQDILKIPYQTAATHLARARLLFRKKIDPKKFGVSLFLLSNILRKRQIKMFENWLIKESDIAKYVDGKLSARAFKRLNEFLVEDPKRRAQVVAMEEAKILLSNALRVLPSETLKLQVYHAVATEEIPEKTFGIEALNNLELAASGVLTASRAIIFGIIVSISLIGLGIRIIQIEHEQKLKFFLDEDKTIKTGDMITTGTNKFVAIHRKGLFTVRLEDGAKLTVNQLSHFGVHGANQFSLDSGALFFKTEHALSKEGLNILVSGLKISNFGTVALIKETESSQVLIAVLKGRVKLQPLQGNRESMMIDAMKECVWDPNEKFQKIELISQESLEKLVDFSEERIVSLGLPEKGAAALVESSQISVAFAFFNVSEPDRKLLFDEVKYLFTKTSDLDAVRRARNILDELSTRYKTENRYDVSAPTELFAAAISAFLKDDLRAIQILTKIFNTPKYDLETRGLAQCALGILYERHSKPEEALKAYQLTVDQFSNTRVANEARERLVELQKHEKIND